MYTVSGTLFLQPGGEYFEAALGEPLAISCRVCGGTAAAAATPRVDWHKEGVPVVESADIRSYRRHSGEFVLRLGSVREADLGNYTCILREGGGGGEQGGAARGGGGSLRRDQKRVVVSLLPPPPEWETALRPAVTSQVLEWRGLSSLPIINYQLEVRLRPEAGEGEDWLSIIVPYQVRLCNLSGISDSVPDPDA
jgi:hypothetical protein